MIELKKEGLEICLAEPGTYYKGVRFDSAGVFRTITKDGYVFADRWFASYDPYKNDAVCGCSEEFVNEDIDKTAVGDKFCKIGAGLLVRPDDQPYSIFRYYECPDGGKWSYCKTDDCSVCFCHELEGWYKYEKSIVLTSGRSFEIRHKLQWDADVPYHGFCYNHNFFTFAGKNVDKGRKITFPFKPAGNWREAYDSVELTDNGIRFFSPVVPPSVFMGNLHNSQGSTPFEFSIEEGDHKVDVVGKVASDAGVAFVDHMVFWANPDVACVEPYLPINLKRGDRFEWTIEYTLK